MMIMIFLWLGVNMQVFIKKGWSYLSQNVIILYSVFML